MLWREKKDRNQADKLPGLSCGEQPAFQTAIGTGPSPGVRGRPAVAVRILFGAVSRAHHADCSFILRALCDLRQL